MVDRVKTGIPKLDKILGGGFPYPAAIGIVGDAGIGKTIFCLQFLYENLKNGSLSWVTSFDNDEKAIKQICKNFGWNVEEYETKKLFKIVDFYSPRFVFKEEVPGAPPSATPVIRAEFTLSDILQRVMQIEVAATAEKRIKCGVVDSFSTLVRMIGPEGAAKFAEASRLRIETSKYIGLGTLTDTAFDVKIAQELIRVAGGAIEMRFKDVEGKLRRFLRIVKMKDTHHPLDWYEFEITPTGIVLK